MTNLFRFGVSLDKKLLDEFDTLIKRKNYSNRSEAFRDLIRQELVKEEWAKSGEVVGAITLVYDHHKRELVNKILPLFSSYLSISTWYARSPILSDEF